MSMVMPVDQFCCQRSVGEASLKDVKTVLHLLILPRMCVCGRQGVACDCEGQRTTCESWFLPSTVWDQEWNLDCWAWERVPLPTEPPYKPEKWRRVVLNTLRTSSAINRKSVSSYQGSGIGVEGAERR